MTAKSDEELEAEIKSLREDMRRMRSKGKSWDAFAVALLLDMLERDLKKRKEAKAEVQE